MNELRHALRVEAGRLLGEQHLSLRVCSSPESKAHCIVWVLGYIEALEDLAALEPNEADGWRERICNCPGHEDGFPQARCSYGGCKSRTMASRLKRICNAMLYTGCWYTASPCMGRRWPSVICREVRRG
ncbi:hypothetical protein [Candidatus Cyanaurora vandensis]|uniref:hypothetical protein n=1 Tax=Candidatus Cyanaurora vandensis TaxID=2714958 RepID=UPI00257F41B7|nr:hypothetical protein [Candidatus Cyanaurora vandensis]